eukprot:6071083-Amphidinium_carterae.2
MSARSDKVGRTTSGSGVLLWAKWRACRTSVQATEERTARRPNPSARSRSSPSLFLKLLQHCHVYRKKTTGNGFL